MDKMETRNLLLTYASLLAAVCAPYAAPGSTARVWAWGDNRFGQTNAPAGLTNVVEIAAGRNFTLARRADGTVVGWGTNDYGQINIPPELSNVVAIAAGGYHSLALSSDGTLAAWGKNNLGQATIHPAATNVVAIAAGDNHSVILRANGTVFAWGDNGRGQTNLASAATNRVTAIAAAGDQTVALLADTTLKGWGYNGYSTPTPPTGLSNVVAISAGVNNCAALKANGNLIVWGNYYDYSARVPASASNGIARVVLGASHGLALRTNGTVIAWGLNNYFQTNVPAGVTNGALIAAGGNHSVAATGDGRPQITLQPNSASVFIGTAVSFAALAASPDPVSFQWLHDGTPIDGATANTLSLSNVQAADAGGYTFTAFNVFGVGRSAVATLTVLDSAPAILQQPVSKVISRTLSNQFSVRVEGSLPISFQWQFQGTNLPGATASALPIPFAQPSQAGVYQVTIGNHLGSVTSAPVVLEVPPLISWPDFGGYGALPFGLTNARAMDCGEDHNIALTADGRVVTWGYYIMQSSAQPTNMTNVVAVAAGWSHALALKADGSVVAWGSDFDFQSIRVGQATVPNGLSNVVAISGGAWHSLVLKSDGTVFGWGNNYGGQLAGLDSLSNIVAISAGEFHNLFLKADGTVLANGWDNYGQVSVPATLSNVIAIAAEGYFSLALQSDGHVVSWGSVGTQPAGLSNVVAIAGGPTALSADGTVLWGPRPPVAPINVIGIASSAYQTLFLLDDGANVIPFSITRTALGENGFTASLPTERGRHYVLLASDSPSPGSWSFVTAIAGDGTTKSLVDPVVWPAGRFYRVVRQ